MSDIESRIMDLYMLKKDLEDQLTEVKALLNDSIAEAMLSGIRTMSNGYRLSERVSKDISIKKLRDQYPEIYQEIYDAKVASYKPELTKTDISRGLKAQTDSLSAERIMADIETGIVTKTYSVIKPADPHAQEES